jgi:hypothetical protein
MYSAAARSTPPTVSLLNDSMELSARAIDYMSS